MGPIKDGVLTTLGAVDCAEIDAWEHSPQLQYKHIAEGSPQRKFPKTSDFLSPAHLTNKTPIKEDRQQLTLTEAVCIAVQMGRYGAGNLPACGRKISTRWRTFRAEAC
jgi:hypothetical protein